MKAKQVDVAAAAASVGKRRVRGSTSDVENNKKNAREGRLGKVKFFCLAACPPSDTGSLLFRAKFC